MDGSAGSKSGKKVSHSKSGSGDLCLERSVDVEGEEMARTWVWRMRTSNSPSLSPSVSSVSVSESGNCGRSWWLEDMARVWR